MTVGLLFPGAFAGVGDIRDLKAAGLRYHMARPSEALTEVLAQGLAGLLVCSWYRSALESSPDESTDGRTQILTKSSDAACPSYRCCS